MDIGVGVTGAFSFSMERLPQKDKAQKCAREIAAALKKYGFDHACTQESTIIDDSHYPDTEVYLVSYGS
jgi:hypothetical protein